jgi:hypothetical protein
MRVRIQVGEPRFFPQQPPLELQALPTSFILIRTQPIGRCPSTQYGGNRSLITGIYSESRCFSFVAYVANGSVTDNGSLIDVDIIPDSGNTNRFRTSPVSSEPQHHTIPRRSFQPFIRK